MKLNVIPQTTRLAAMILEPDVNAAGIALSYLLGYRETLDRLYRTRA